ncbi:MAG TPA: nucleoside hydrolase [Planctomycetota bacterium]
MLIALALLALSPVEGLPQAKVIFDADMDSDCDDVAALGVLHALADRGEAEILATISSSTNPWTPKCMDAVNTFYKRPDVPIGAPAKGVGRKSKYAQGVAETFPHDLKEVADAAGLYLDLLGRQPDGSVTIVTVGYLTNLAALVGRDPELVKKKVKLWVCMGGNFIGKPAKDDLKLGNVNFTTEKEGALAAIRDWPGPILFAGREVCSVPSGVKVGARFKELPEKHPVRHAYALYFGGEPKDRHVADLVAALVAVRGLGERWGAETKGRMDLKPDMTFEWREGGEQAYLLKKAPDREIEKELEALLLKP